MPARSSDAFLLFLAVSLVVLGLLAVDAARQQERQRRALVNQRAMVRVLGLTDLCLFTEARHTRHPGLADLHAAFQEHPAALDHFPSGSLLRPPPRLRPRPAEE